MQRIPLIFRLGWEGIALWAEAVEYERNMGSEKRNTENAEP